jgi:hypothetical protein
MTFLGMGITPYKGKVGGTGGGITIAQIISDYGYLNAWGAGNLTIAGTSTTADDYLSEHNLVNPAATNQPTYSASDANFNGNPSLSYDGVDDYLTKSVSNYRGSDTTGIITAVFNLNDDTAGQNNFLFTSANSTINTEFLSIQYQDKKLQIALVSSGSVVYSLEYAVTLNLNQSYVASVFSNGSTVKLCLDGVIQTFTVSSGANAGEWLDVPTTNNISIGARARTSNNYGKSKSSFIGYSPYSTEASIISMGNKLKTLNGI